MSKLIHDNIHGYMEFEPLCLQIIDSPEFQRLRNLKQLGAASYVFPCGNHSRFEHSLGVAYLSELMLKNIKSNQPELNLDERIILLVKIAGLIHDLGHGCYSHFFDNILLKNSNSLNKYHETRSCWIFKNMISKYNINITDNEFNFIKELILPPKYKITWLHQIVANSINGLDTDKFDYLKRDTQAIGLPYSIDSSRILMQARVINNMICYPYKEVYSIYEMFHTRYRLHKQIYTHPVIQQIEFMILDILELIDPIYKISDSINNISDFIKISDDILDFIYYMDDGISDKIIKAKNIIEKIKKRDLYSFIDEIDCNFIKNKIKVSDFLNIDPDLKKDEIILHYMCIGYTGNSHNPLDDILFYKTENINNAFKCDKHKVSQLIPEKFNEKILRVFSKNKNNNTKIKDILIKILNNQ